MKANVNLIIGTIFIMIGILFLGPVMGLFSLVHMWPAVLLLIGIGLLISYIAYPKVYGLLMPASILIFSSVPFFICTLSGDWSKMTTLWPIFIISVSLGFFFMYFLGKKEKALLVTAFIILGIGIVTFLIFNYVKFLFPIIFIAAGLTLIFIGVTGSKKQKSELPETTIAKNENRV